MNSKVEAKKANRAKTAGAFAFFVLFASLKIQVEIAVSVQTQVSAGLL
jgi:hypothetical protein